MQTEAQAALDAAKSERQSHLTAGDLADGDVVTALHGRVDAAQSQLAGLNEARAALTIQIADAEAAQRATPRSGRGQRKTARGYYRRCQKMSSQLCGASPRDVRIARVVEQFSISVRWRLAISTATPEAPQEPTASHDGSLQKTLAQFHRRLLCASAPVGTRRKKRAGGRTRAFERKIWDRSEG
jgi:hypothetical protein